MEQSSLLNKATFDAPYYIKQFKALADEKRLMIIHILATENEACVCDLEDRLDLPQSKLSYHLGILLKAELIEKETRGTWSFYSLNEGNINGLLSEELCCVLKPSNGTCC
jgi:ArsR family transcriptional regulator